MNDSTSEFTVSHFALADDALTDVLSEALVLAMRVNTLKMTSATIVDLLAFLPKDRFFMSLVNFVFASGDGVLLSPSSATRQIISGFLLFDSDFAANVSNKYINTSIS
jgi:hypothetical protein